MNKSEIQSEKKTILIVDDLEINREILIGILQPDYTLLEAGSAAEAIKVLTENLYTCLLYTSPSPRDRTRSRMPSSA